MNEITNGKVFLGVPAVLTAGQEPLLEQWLEWLKGQALEVVRLQRDAYGQDSWRMLTELLSQADGAVLLGFRQLDARAAVWRPHTNDEVHGVGWWTTPWLHLEAGMAIASGLPVLVAPDEGVEEGVFSSDAWTSRVHGVALGSPGKACADWLELVRRHHRRDR